MLLLGEAPSAIQLLGAATILTGLVLATLRLRGEPPRQAVAEPEIG
jgi:drug/metabolite transporter (DMT)-like permease